MYKQIVQRHSGGCMMIVRKGENKDAGVSFICTGFLCHSEGYVLTCAHGINLTDNLAIIPPQPINEFNKMSLGRVSIIDVDIAQYDSVNDVALLKIKNPIGISYSDNMFSMNKSHNVGTSVCYMGFPFGDSGLHTLKVSETIISSKVKNEKNTDQYQLDSMIHDGNSGGPLLELQTGQIIGIITGKYSPTGAKAVIQIGNRALGQDSSISFATSISYGIELMKSEGLDV